MGGGAAEARGWLGVLKAEELDAKGDVAYAERGGGDASRPAMEVEAEGVDGGLAAERAEGGGGDASCAETESSAWRKEGRVVAWTGGLGERAVGGGESEASGAKEVETGLPGKLDVSDGANTLSALLGDPRDAVGGCCCARVAAD